MIAAELLCSDLGSIYGWYREQSGKAGAIQRRAYVASAVRSEAGENCGSGDPALRRAGLSCSAGRRHSHGIEHRQGIGFSALQEQGWVVPGGVQEGGAVVSQVHGGARRIFEERLLRCAVLL